MIHVQLFVTFFLISDLHLMECLVCAPNSLDRNMGILYLKTTRDLDTAIITTTILS